MSDANIKKYMCALCFGEPIVFINIHTGGMLTIKSSMDQRGASLHPWSLIVLLYQTNGGTGNTENNQSLISYMQYHNK
eukprot:309417-Ditylum_brightwellii.AAC.1